MPPAAPTAALLRAYANIADDLPHAGYTTVRDDQVKADVERYIKLRDHHLPVSGQTISIQPYEADICPL